MTMSSSDGDRLVRLGTRGSPLALAQAHMAIAALEQAPGIAPGCVSLHSISTLGDRVQDRPLAELGGKALWTRELDRALLDGRIDVAVHSMKDVETRLAPGIALAAVLPRADPRDRLVGADSISALAPGAVVGTSSPRRAAQLLHRRPDVRVEILRGNVETRLRHVTEGRYAATFLAAAGLDRLGIEAGVSLALDDWLPAAGQAIVGLVCRADDLALCASLRAVSHAETMLRLRAERAFLDALGGNCHSAISAHARIECGLVLAAELFSPDGREWVAGTMAGEEPEAVAVALAAQLMARAGPAIRQSLSASEPV